MKEQTLEDGSVIAAIDADTFTITPPPQPVKVSDLQSQRSVLVARQQQVGQNYDDQKAAALADIQKDIDAIDAQLGSAAMVGCAAG